MVMAKPARTTATTREDGRLMVWLRRRGHWLDLGLRGLPTSQCPAPRCRTQGQMSQVPAVLAVISALSLPAAHELLIRRLADEIAVLPTGIVPERGDFGRVDC